MIGVSACLGGCPVRFDGRDQRVVEIEQLVKQQEAIMICPEVLGGLPIPRDPAEIIGGDGFAVWHGELKEKGIDTLILKEKSPSCGSQWIYDGTFSGTKIKGVGVATAYFLNQGIKVYSESQWLKGGKVSGS